MKGKNTFTAQHVQEIKKLISEKVGAPADKQKGIRAKIRSMGFYYSDFKSNNHGYKVADFEALISEGSIKISKGDFKIVKTTSPAKNFPNPKPLLAAALPIGNLLSFQDNISKFISNKFDPKYDSVTKIDNKPGNYILCLKRNEKLPAISIKPTLTRFEGFEVVYTGIASVSLRTRDFAQHFKGNNAGRSTLRKSLGVLFGYKQIPRDSDQNSGKTKFGNVDEQKLSNWMQEKLLMYFLPNFNFNDLEAELITHFNPPLNLQGNHNFINRDFRRLLSSLRSEKS